MNILNKKKFSNLSNTNNGDVNHQTIFHYNQNGSIITASYQGGVIKTGSIIGKMLTDTTYEIYYQHITTFNELRTGHCHSQIEILPNGLLKLKEHWQWLNGDLSKGYSELIEIE